MQQSLIGEIFFFPSQREERRAGIQFRYCLYLPLTRNHGASELFVEGQLGQSLLRHSRQIQLGIAERQLKDSD